MADGSTPIEIEEDWVDTTDGDWVDSKAFKPPNPPPSVQTTSTTPRRVFPNQGMQRPGPIPKSSGKAKVADLLGPAAYLTGISGWEKMSEGLHRTQNPQEGETRGGISDMILGGLEASTPFALSSGLPSAINFVRDKGMAYALPRLIGGMAGGGAAGWAGDQGGRAYADAMGGSKGQQELMGTLTSLPSALLGSIYGGGGRLVRPPAAPANASWMDKLKSYIPSVEMRTPPAPKFQPAPRTEIFTHTLLPKEADLLRPDYEQRVERGVSEILQDHPDLVDGSFILTRPGSSLKTIRDYAAATADRVWQTGLRSVQPYVEKGATFIPSNTTRRMYEALPLDPVGEGRLMADVSPQLQKEIMELDKKPMTFKKAWELWREWNADTGPLHTKSGVKGRQAVIANEGDITVKAARVDGLKEDIYNFLKTQDPAQAEHLMEVMNTYGSVAQVRNGMEGQLVNAYREVPTGMIDRLQNLGMAAAKIKGGGSFAWAAPNVRAAVSADNTIANQLLQGFKQFGAPLPKLAEWTPRSFYAPAARRDLVDRLMPPIPPSRQLAAPTGPIGVSGVTVPDVRGQITQAAGRFNTGPRMLPPAPPPPAPNPTAKAYGGNPQPRVPQGQAPPVQQPSILEQYGRGVSVPAVRTGNPFAQPGQAGTSELSPQRVGQYALEHGLDYGEALRRLQLQMDAGRRPNPWRY